MKYAPPPFPLPDGNKAVFAKFLSATYELTFDCVSESVTVKTTIDLIVPEFGRPVIDLSTTKLVGAITSVKVIASANVVSALEEYQVPLTGQDAVLATSDWRPLVSVLLEPLAPGATHTVEIQHTLKSHPKPKELLWDKANKSVYCFFEMSDETPGRDTTYDGRHFLERYVPANFEYDQFSSVWIVKVTGTGKPHMLVTSVSSTPIELAPNSSATFTTPQWYSASSLFFFLGEKSETQFAPPFSVDGVPITVFTYKPAAAATLAKWQTQITTKMERLRRDLGPFPCPHLIVYAGMGMGMEYANAIAATENNLLHELVHCYLGRSILPADGDSGWIDEGFAVWYEAKLMLPPQTNPPGPASKIGGIRPYRRGTDRRAWTQGRTMMAYLDHLLKNAGKGGLCDLVKLGYVGSAQGTLVTTADLQAVVEQLTGVDLAAVFQRCIRS